MADEFSDENRIFIACVQWGWVKECQHSAGFSKSCKNEGREGDH